MTLGIASVVGEVCGKSLIVSVHTKDGLQVSLRVGDLGSHVDHISPKVRFRLGDTGKRANLGLWVFSKSKTLDRASLLYRKAWRKFLQQGLHLIGLF